MFVRNLSHSQEQTGGGVLGNLSQQKYHPGHILFGRLILLGTEGFILSEFPIKMHILLKHHFESFQTLLANTSGVFLERRAPLMRFCNKETELGEKSSEMRHFFSNQAP